MTVEEFKKIFFWEWLHRAYGRGIGIAFAGMFKIGRVFFGVVCANTNICSAFCLFFGSRKNSTQGSIEIDRYILFDELNAINTRHVICRHFQFGRSARFGWLVDGEERSASRSR
jgi:hypothetical protein